MPEFPGGIYGILPGGLDIDALLEKAEAAMRGGLRLLQYRNKHADFDLALRQCQALRACCRDYDCHFIVNDSLRLARACKADGVHLGRGDVGRLDTLRDELGSGMWLGITCRADVDWARRVVARCQADYLSFGAVFASRSKPEVPVLGLARLRGIRAALPQARICAIGGIDESNLAAVRECGADAAAMISSLFSRSDVERYCRKLTVRWRVPPAV